MEANEKIQKIKRLIMGFIRFDRWHENSLAGINDDVLWIVEQVATSNLGFASEVAKTVATYKKASEKQAYVIARAAVESGLAEKISYYFDDETEEN